MTRIHQLSIELGSAHKDGGSELSFGNWLRKHAHSTSFLAPSAAEYLRLLGKLSAHYH